MSEEIKKQRPHPKIRAVKRTNNLGEDSIISLVLRLAIPTMLAQFVSVLYSIVDRMYIGVGVGNLALAGVGVCGPIVTLLSSFASLVGLGGAPIMSIRMGEGNAKMAKRVLNNSFLMLLMLSAAPNHMSSRSLSLIHI